MSHIVHFFKFPSKGLSLIIFFFYNYTILLIHQPDDIFCYFDKNYVYRQQKKDWKLVIM